MQCLPEGEYEASIAKIEEDVISKSSGKEMTIFHFDVYAGNRTVRLKDYIVNPDSLWKLKKIAKAIGKMAQFESGVFKASDYAGETLTVTLKIKSDPGYDDQNNIVGYATLQRQTAAPNRGASATITSKDIDNVAKGDDDDSIPF